MITKQELDNAVKQENEAQEIINQYYREQQEAFDRRMKENPIFTDEELFYSAITLCPCGHGLAYPRNCSVNHYWDCSAILKGEVDEAVEHVAQLPFSMTSIKGESEHNGTTRGVFKPKES
ncbi:MAG: hypothetical protein E3J47_08345 [Candidatus Stahlbacteria bacterium]|nr:MAG: hypothetical protein E3J47_08345 [Candidatus Stahlbacteria bacterium]